MAVAGLLRRDERLGAQACKPAKIRAELYPGSTQTSHGMAPVSAVVGTTGEGRTCSSTGRSIQIVHRRPPVPSATSFLGQAAGEART